MILYLSEEFYSAHFYHQPQWTDEQNRQTFGRCFTPHGHGHNYRLTVGFKINEKDLAAEKQNLQKTLKKLTTPLDHEHLNYVIPEFQKTIPTTENIALYFVHKLKQEPVNFKSVRLQETDTLWTEIQL